MERKSLAQSVPVLKVLSIAHVFFWGRKHLLQNHIQSVCSVLSILSGATGQVGRVIASNCSLFLRSTFKNVSFS